MDFGGSGFDCSGGHCDIGGFDAGHSHYSHSHSDAFHHGHDSSWMYYAPVYDDSCSYTSRTRCGGGTSSQKPSGNPIVKVASITVGGFVALDGLRRIAQLHQHNEPNDQKPSQTWTGMLELLGGLALATYGLMR